VLRKSPYISAKGRLTLLEHTYYLHQEGLAQILLQVSTSPIPRLPESPTVFHIYQRHVRPKQQTDAPRLSRALGARLRDLQVIRPTRATAPSPCVCPLSVPCSHASTTSCRLLCLARHQSALPQLFPSMDLICASFPSRRAHPHPHASSQRVIPHSMHSKPTYLAHGAPPTLTQLARARH
jgi:hypothetical protein